MLFFRPHDQRWGSMAPKNMDKAKAGKNDEFYTGYDDIKKELVNYAKYFKGKTIYCNCDDHNGIGLGTPKSNFLKYLADNFQAFGLKKVIATHYETNKKSKMYVLTKDNTGDGIICNEDIEESALKGNGDFRSDECIELLKQADIVITNPPFSLFREYVSQLMEYKKKFLIIGHQNAISYKETFKLIRENKLWLGNNNLDTGRFIMPGDYDITKSKYAFEKDGVKYGRVSGLRWFTNLDINKRHEYLDTGKKYHEYEDMYPKYDNYDAINVDKTVDIPMDYNGIIGVPITFLDKHNPDQFEIIALGIVGSCEFTENKKMEILDKQGQPTGKFTFNAKGTLYRKFNPEKDDFPAFKNAETGELYSSIYARVLIKRKKGN